MIVGLTLKLRSNEVTEIVTVLPSTSTTTTVTPVTTDAALTS